MSNLDQGSEILLTLADHARLADIGARLQRGLNTAWAHVLPASGNDDVLLTVNDPQHTVVADPADVTSADTIGAAHVGGRDLVLPVAREASRRHADDLVVGPEQDLVARIWPADGARLRKRSELRGYHAA